MKRALRSNFEPGSPREAVRRAQWRALGLSDEDMLKPKIAVVNSSSELAICFSHLDGAGHVLVVRGIGPKGGPGMAGPASRELNERRRHGEPGLPKARGYLSIYQRSVQPMSTGAVLVEPD